MCYRIFRTPCTWQNLSNIKNLTWIFLALVSFINTIIHNYICSNKIRIACLFYCYTHTYTFIHAHVQCVYAHLHIHSCTYSVCLRTPTHSLKEAVRTPRLQFKGDASVMRREGGGDVEWERERKRIAGGGGGQLRCPLLFTSLHLPVSIIYCHHY